METSPAASDLHVVTKKKKKKKNNQKSKQTLPLPSRIPPECLQLLNIQTITTFSNRT